MAERTNHTCCLPGYFNARLSFLWPGPARAEEVMFGKVGGDFTTDSEEDYSEISGSDRDEEITWIEWFCHLKGNEFFVEVDEDYIQDDFNLTGLSAQVPCYEDALNMILDFDDQDDHRLQDDQQPLVETAAQMLYGLIHARFILTSRGMAAMLDKYNCYVYGKCPLTQCEAMNQAVLPIGTSDMLRQSAAKVYCPHCREIYFPKSSKLECLDGAYFGTTFAHLFFLTYQQLVPPTMPQPHCPRIYGFKIHKSVKENLRRQNERAQKQLPGQFFVTGPTAVFGKASLFRLKELGALSQQALERRSWWTDNVGTEITAAEFSVVPAIQSTECAVQVTLGRADVDFQARGCQASPSLAEDAFSSFFRPFAPYGPPLRALCVGRLEFEPSSEEVHRGPGGARQGFAQGACLSAPRDTQGGPVEMRDEAI
eukprot:s63_g3.t1